MPARVPPIWPINRKLKECWKSISPAKKG
jgi:hypothetical protein